MSRYGVFSGLYFPVFGLNAEIYGVNLRIKYGPKKTPYLNTFHTGKLHHLFAYETFLKYFKWRKCGADIELHKILRELRGIFFPQIFVFHFARLLMSATFLKNHFFCLTFFQPGTLKSKEILD